MLKTVNATCANNNVLRVVQQSTHGKECYGKCTPAERAEPTSNCSTLCFFQTVIGRSKSFPQLAHSGMQGSALTSAWMRAFDSDDPAQGGCPAQQ